MQTLSKLLQYHYECQAQVTAVTFLEGAMPVLAASLVLQAAAAWEISFRHL